MATTITATTTTTGLILSARLILQTLRPFNVFILLNGWICLHGVLD